MVLNLGSYFDKNRYCLKKGVECVFGDVKKRGPHKKIIKGTLLSLPSLFLLLPFSPPFRVSRFLSLFSLIPSFLPPFPLKHSTNFFIRDPKHTFYAFFSTSMLHFSSISFFLFLSHFPPIPSPSSFSNTIFSTCDHLQLHNIVYFLIIFYTPFWTHLTRRSSLPSSFPPPSFSLFSPSIILMVYFYTVTTNNKNRFLFL